MERELGKYTLTIILNPGCDKVLMCYHAKQNAYNFIGGHVRDEENYLDASYRELKEETGITKVNVHLAFIRREFVVVNANLYDHDWEMYVSFGVLRHDVSLIEEKNHLMWMPLGDRRIDTESMGFGNCRVFLNEALQLLNNGGYHG